DAGARQVCLPGGGRAATRFTGWLGGAAGGGPCPGPAPHAGALGPFFPLGGPHGGRKGVGARHAPDVTMQRRVVNTGPRDDGPRWEDLAARALAYQPPYRPIPGTALYHVSVDDHLVQVGEYDLDGPLRDLVTVVLAMGQEV